MIGDLIRRSIVASLIGSTFLCGAHAFAQRYPSRPVTVIIPTGPGSVSENEGRIHMAKLAENLLQPFVIDFKAGASGIIGMTYVAKAAPDGYTLLMSSASLSMVPLMEISMPFDRLNAFAPVSLLSKRWAVMAVHPSMPTKAADFIAYAKANPDKVNFGTSGSGKAQHLTGAWMGSVTGAPVTYIHYKSSGLAQTDLIGGRIHITPMTLTSALPHIKSGKIRALGLANLQRNPAYPDLPTLAEQGWAGFEYSSWQGVLAPSKTPLAIVNLLSANIAKGIKDPEVIKRLESQTQLIGSSPDEFARYMSTETERWRKLLKETGIELSMDD